jgi:hypothetical protein
MAHVHECSASGAASATVDCERARYEAVRTNSLTCLRNPAQALPRSFSLPVCMRRLSASKLSLVQYLLQHSVIARGQGIAYVDAGPGSTSTSAQSCRGYRSFRVSKTDLSSPADILAHPRRDRGAPDHRVHRTHCRHRQPRGAEAPAGRAIRNVVKQLRPLRSSQALNQTAELMSCTARGPHSIGSLSNSRLSAGATSPTAG